MKKPIIFLLFLMLSITFLQGQTSLANKLSENGRKILSIAKDNIENKQYDKALKRLNFMIRQIEKPNSQLNDTLLIIDFYALSAECYFLKSDKLSALKRFQKALELKQSIYDENHKEVKTTYALIGYLKETENTDKALNYLLSAYNTENNRLSSWMKISLITTLADLSFQLEYYQMADEYYHLIINTILSTQEVEDIKIAELLLQIGDNYREKNKFEKSNKYYFKANEILLRDPDHFNTAIFAVYTGIAENFFYQDDYDSALEYYNNALELGLILFGKDSENLLYPYGAIGKTYLLKENFLLAQKYYENELSIREILKLDQETSVASTYLGLGIIASRLKNYDKALEFYNKYLVFAKIENDYTEVVHTLNDIGLIYSDLNNANKALESYVEALNYYNEKEIKDNSIEALLYSNIGGVYIEIGDYKSGLKYTNKALQTSLPVIDTDKKLAYMIYTNFGHIQLGFGNYISCVDFFQKALDASKEILGVSSMNIINAYSNLGIALTLLNEDAQAFNNFSMALDIFIESEINSPKTFVTIMANIAVVVSSLGQDSLAIQASELAIEQAEANPETCASAIGNLYGGLGLTHINTGNSKAAIEYLNKAITLYPSFYKKTQPKFYSLYSGLSYAYFLDNDSISSFQAICICKELLETQILNYFKFIPERFKASYIHTFSTFMDNYFSLAVKYKQSNDRSEMLNSLLRFKGTILQSEREIRQIIKGSENPVLDSVYLELANNSQYLYNLAFSKPYFNHQESLFDSLMIVNDALNLEISQVHNSIHKNTIETYISSDSIKQHLSLNEAAIEFFDFKDILNTNNRFYGAFLLRKNHEQPIIISLFNESEFNSFSSKFYGEPLDVKISEMYLTSKRGKKLYDLCWSPIDSLLKGISTVYVSTSGLLHNISLSILPIGNDSILSDKYEFHYVSSIAELANKSLKSPTVENFETLTMYSDIAYDSCNATNNDTLNIPRPAGMQCNTRKWSQLTYFTGTESMIDLLPSVDKVDTLTGIYATKESLLDLDGHSPDILHLFTHGFYCSLGEETLYNQEFLYTSTDFNIYKQHQNPLIRTGLVMAGGNKGWMNGTEEGILTAHEILSLDLSNTDLVILSACVTGLGDIEPYEGVYGMQRALKVAGVDNIIMSLWSVTDKHTMLFFEKFYTYLGGKLTIWEAFYSAQEFMRQTFPNSPDHWGGFILLE